MIEEKKSRGGARKGSGPKPKGENRVKVNFMLLPQVVDWLRSQDRRPSQVIEKIILDNYMKNS